LGFFSTKKIHQRNNSLGDLLKNTRLKYKLKLHHITEFTNIRRSYIVAIENNNWDQLPDLTYAKNFVLCYAKFLELDTAKIINRFDLEVTKYQAKNSTPTSQFQPKRTFVVTPRLLTTLFAILIVIGVGCYAYFQINYLAQIPKLQINEPADYTQVVVNKVQISGQTDPDNTIYINNQPLTTDKHGNFSTPIQLQNGYNIIQVTAENKIGKKTTATKVIIANLDNSTDKEINLTVSATKADVWIRLKTLSGETIFDGVVSAGSDKSFTNLEPFLFTTSNAGATTLVINGKTLGSLGKDNEIVEDLQISNQPDIKHI
jgi:cytoskeleton protein RodZ